MAVVRPTQQNNKTTAGNHSGIAVLAVADTSTDPDILDFRGYRTGVYETPSTLDAVAITFKVCNIPGGTYVPLKDRATGAAISQTVTTSSAYPLPAELEGAAFVQMVLGTAQSPAASIRVSCKG